MELQELIDLVERRFAELRDLIGRPAPKEWYRAGEAAAELGKSEYTVRNWCRLGRLRAEKKGDGQDWWISREELDRYRNYGLLPLRRGG